MMTVLDNDFDDDCGDDDSALQSFLLLLLRLKIVMKEVKVLSSFRMSIKKKRRGGGGGGGGERRGGWRVVRAKTDEHIKALWYQRVARNQAQWHLARAATTRWNSETHSKAVGLDRYTLLCRVAQWACHL